MLDEQKEDTEDRIVTTSRRMKSASVEGKVVAASGAQEEKDEKNE